MKNVMKSLIVASLLFTGNLYAQTPVTVQNYSTNLAGGATLNNLLSVGSVIQSFTLVNTGGTNTIVDLWSAPGAWTYYTNAAYTNYTFTTGTYTNVVTNNYNEAGGAVWYYTNTYTASVRSLSTNAAVTNVAYPFLGRYIVGASNYLTITGPIGAFNGLAISNNQAPLSVSVRYVPVQ